MRRVLPLLMLATVAAVAACTAPSAPPPPPRPPVAPQPAQVVVFLAREATAAQQEAVAAAMRAEPGASDVRFMSAKEAYAEFKRSFADRRDLVETVKPDDVPASLRVTLANQTAAEAAAGRFRALPGVEDVQVTPTATATPAPR